MCSCMIEQRHPFFAVFGQPKQVKVLDQHRHETSVTRCDQNKLLAMPVDSPVGEKSAASASSNSVCMPLRHSRPKLLLRSAARSDMRSASESSSPSPAAAAGAILKEQVLPAHQQLIRLLGRSHGVVVAVQVQPAGRGAKECAAAVGGAAVKVAAHGGRHAEAAGRADVHPDAAARKGAQLQRGELERLDRARG